MTNITLPRAVVEQALEALEADNSKLWPSEKRAAAITAIREALAEQPAQQALDKMAENARELGLDYEPAQQEPVATDWERIARVQDAKLRAMCNEPGGFEKLCEVMDKYERTSPPASKPWVGLTPEQRATIAEANNMLVDDDLFDAIEAKLREKNV